MSPSRTPTLVAYARYETAAGRLETAASTLAACHATGAVWDYLLGLALACKHAAEAIVIAAPLADKARAAKVGQYLPEALWLLSIAYSLHGERTQARLALDEALAAAQATGSVRLAARIGETMA